MNKRLKGIFAASGLLAVLGGLVVVLKLTAPEDAAESSTAEETSVKLWSAYADDINRITVENPKGDSYSAFRKKETVETTDSQGQPMTQEVCNYYLEGYEALPMNTTEIRTLASRAPELAAVDTVQEHASADDLKKYGLDQPIKVEFKVDNKDDIRFEIGDRTPIENNYYLRMDGGDTVYTVSNSAMSPFLNGINDYLGTTLREEQADDDDTIVKSVRIERKNLDYDLFFEYDKYFEANSQGGGLAQHVMVEPIPALLNGDKSSAATHGLYGLTAKEVLTPFPTKADKKAAGLDDPFVRVTMITSDRKKTVFLLGNTYEDEDGNKLYYGYMEGLDCIYGFRSDDICYDDVKAEDVTSKNIVSLYVWDIAKITYKTPDLTLDFEGEGESADDYVLKLDGEKQEEVERFRQLYSFLLQAKAENLILDSVDIPGDPLCSVTIKAQRGLRDMQLDFYDAGSMKAYIAVDGVIRFSCRKSYVDTLIKDIEMYSDSDKEFITTW